jgi:hypothetical protein
MDNIVNKATEHGPYTYGYDSLYRLVTADGGPLTAESYSYDPVGNRLTSATANNWTYNQNNELQSYNARSRRKRAESQIHAYLTEIISINLY